MPLTSQGKTSCPGLSALAVSCGPPPVRSRLPAAAAGASAAADRDHQGRGHRQRLHLPQRQPSVDVHRHQRRRDRDRPDRLRPAAGGQHYVDEIKKVTNKPIKYLIYSHHHYDHIAGGKPFKDAGATIVAHKRAKERLAVLKDPHTVLPDETVGDKRTHHARRHDARAALPRPQPLRHHAGDAAAEGEDHLRRRLDSGRRVAGPRHDRLLSARDRGLRSRKCSRWTGSA